MSATATVSGALRKAASGQVQSSLHANGQAVASAPSQASSARRTPSPHRGMVVDVEVEVLVLDELDDDVVEAIVEVVLVDVLDEVVVLDDDVGGPLVDVEIDVVDTLVDVLAMELVVLEDDE